MMTDSPKTRPRALLTPVALHILMSLAEGTRHGYGIKRDVEEATGGALHLGPGTLYEAMHRMEEQGWVEVVDPDTLRDEPDFDARRKYYALTDAGRAEMESELARLDELLEHAREHSLMPRKRDTR
ncbi:MAG: PadR family transcriptional regulator [Acidobacteriota bacterium]|jgi:DNA-binding PadR family transcriptional regulator